MAFDHQETRLEDFNLFFKRTLSSTLYSINVPRTRNPFQLNSKLTQIIVNFVMSFIFTQGFLNQLRPNNRRHYWLLWLTSYGISERKYKWRWLCQAKLRISYTVTRTFKIPLQKKYHLVTRMLILYYNWFIL